MKQHLKDADWESALANNVSTACGLLLNEQNVWYMAMHEVTCRNCLNTKLFKERNAERERNVERELNVGRKRNVS